MSLISRRDLATLIGYRDGEGDCVSIYMPTHRATNEIEQDRIRLKTLLNEAEEELLSAGLSEGDVADLLAPIREQLAPQPTFWQHQLDGLCIFRSSELLYAYRLPYSFEELVTVSPRFHLKPLWPMLSGDGQFYLLTLHKDSVELYQGTRYGMSHLTLSEMPQSTEELLLERDLERPQQWHTETQVSGAHPRVRGARPAMFHGHGMIEQHEEDDILRYYREVDRALDPIWGDEAIPLVLAGNDTVVDLYRRANTYPYLLEEESVRVNPASLDPEELHARAWEIVEPGLLSEMERAEKDYRMWAGRDSDRASHDLKTIVSAAYFERVKVLFVAVGAQAWGTFDPEANAIHIDDEPTPENGDLLDFAAIHTLLNSGTVYAVPAAEIPGDGDLAAIFRYPM